jgi:hypothetical protein
VSKLENKIDQVGEIRCGKDPIHADEYEALVDMGSACVSTLKAASTFP